MDAEGRQAPDQTTGAAPGKEGGALHLTEEQRAYWREWLTNMSEEDIKVVVEELRRLGYMVKEPVMSEGTNAVE